jgi:hypothetical protein
MQTITARVSFLHNARPPINPDEYTNITASFPAGALPNKGDIVQLENIEDKRGAYIVSHRVFEIRRGALNACTLFLGIEGMC